MATSPWEMFGGHKPREKPLSECVVCQRPAAYWPHPNRNVRFCDAHATAILVATVNRIVRGEADNDPEC